MLCIAPGNLGCNGITEVLIAVYHHVSRSLNNIYQGDMVHEFLAMHADCFERGHATQWQGCLSLRILECALLCGKGGVALWCR